jgi:hypothetical protein
VPANPVLEHRIHTDQTHADVAMFVLARAVTYAALFIGLVLIYVPARVLSWSGIVAPPAFAMQQAAGMVIGTAGAGLALWSIVAFVAIGRARRHPSIRPAVS